MTNKIKAFWEARAKSYKTDATATLSEVQLRELEIKAILRYLSDDTKVLDIGCGNGYSTLKFAEKRRIQIVGIDFSQAMIDYALENLSNNPVPPTSKVEFLVGDVLELDFPPNHFDILISERCLQNLVSWEDQKRAILNVTRVLKPYGLFVMAECSVTGLDKLIHILNLFGKKEAENIMPWHNLFLCDKHFINDPAIRKQLVFIKLDNFASTYTLMTRLFPIPGHIASLLPNFGSFGYLKLFLWRKRI